MRVFQTPEQKQREATEIGKRKTRLPHNPVVRRRDGHVCQGEALLSPCTIGKRRATRPRIGASSSASHHHARFLKREKNRRRRARAL